MTQVRRQSWQQAADADPPGSPNHHTLAQAAPASHRQTRCINYTESKKEKLGYIIVRSKA